MSTADELLKLNDLKDRGLLTDAEFQQQKGLLLGQQGTSVASNNTPNAVPEWATIPLRKKWWFQAVWALFFCPVGLVLLAVFPSYIRRKGQVRRVGAGAKIFVSVCLLLLLALALARALA